MTVDAYVNKIHVSGGLGGQVSATYTLAVPQHTGQAYHHELWKHQVPVSLLVANSTTLRRAVSSAAHKFQFFARSSDFDTGVQVDSEISFLSFARKSASATPVRGSTRYRTGTVLEYIDFNLLAKTIRHCIQVYRYTEITAHTHTRTGYINIPEYTEVYGEGTRT